MSVRDLGMGWDLYEFQDGDGAFEAYLSRDGNFRAHFRAATAGEARELALDALYAAAVDEIKQLREFIASL